MPPTFDEIISDSLAIVPICTGGDLLRFDIDLFYYLDRYGLFARVETYQTLDPRCAVIATCKLGDQPREVRELKTTLNRIWKEWLTYAFYEAHEISHAGNNLIFRFVTRSGDRPGALCLTGKIIVLGVRRQP